MSDFSNYSTDELDELQRAMSQQFSATVRVEPSDVRELGDAALLVGTMSYRRQGADNEPDRKVVQTAVIFEDANLDLPQFLLAPQATGLIGKLLWIVARFSEVTFPESPEFMRHYRVVGTLEPAIRTLFTPELREHLQQHPNWSLRGEGKRLVIFHENQVIPEEKLDEFVHEALRILALFRSGEQELDAHPEIRRQAKMADLIEATGRTEGVMGSIVGERLRVQLLKLAISPAELEAFAQCVAPREVPAGIKRQVVGENLLVVLIGFIFLVVGLILGGGVFFINKGIDRYIGLLFLIVFPVIGGLMAFGTLAHRRCKLRLLREGTLTTAIIRRIKDSNILTNGEFPQYVTLIYKVDETEQSQSTMVYGPSAVTARKLQGTNTPARILVDPLDPRHIVCLDFLQVLD